MDYSRKARAKDGQGKIQPIYHKQARRNHSTVSISDLKYYEIDVICPINNLIFSGEKMGIDVRFNPRREGSYNLELILEYHIKSLMGLAKTIKKETLALNGIAKGTENSLRLDSNFIVFEKEELQKETALSSDRLIM